MGGNARDGHAAVRRICIQLGGESVRVGQKLGYKLGNVGALPHEMLAKAMEGEAKSYAEIERLMTEGGAGQAERSDYQRPSMAQDMEKGRRTEIEFMNGFIATEGARAGVKAPTHEMLTRQVLRVERGEIRPTGERPGQQLVWLRWKHEAAGSSKQRGRVSEHHQANRTPWWLARRDTHTCPPADPRGRPGHRGGVEMAGRPVWSHDGIVCTGESYKQVVKLTFARGASIDDRKLFNASLEVTHDVRSTFAKGRRSTQPHSSNSSAPPRPPMPRSPERPAKKK